MNLRPESGIYDTLLDQTLADLLSRYPELRTVFGKLESEEQPFRHANFVSKILKQALREEPALKNAWPCATTSSICWPALRARNNWKTAN